MINTPLFKCLLAALSVFRCVGAVAPSTTPDVAFDVTAKMDSPGAGLHALAYCWFKQQPDVRRFEDGSYDNWRCTSAYSYFWRSPE